jgi:signal transduction histidine kinase
MQTYKVLIVDDEAGMRSGSERSFEGFTVPLADFADQVNFTVASAGTGLDALRLIADDRPDIILLDYKLPDITGLEVFEKIENGAKDMAVIMITAFASLEVAVSATKSGAFDFLAKPFTPEELRSAVQKAVRHIYLQRKARKLEEEKNHVRFQFISVLAHELKSPLAAIEGYLRIMEERLKGGELKDYAGMVDRSLVRIGGMHKLVTDLLDLTGLESGRKKRELAPIDLVKAATAAAESVSARAKSAGVAMELRLPDKLVFSADPGEMDMIFSNLLTNAVKYNRRGGKVTLRLSAAEGWVNIECSDTGIGMTEAEVSRLFREFTRIKNEHTKNIGGSGLGLSILDRVVRLYSGDISVDSRYGEGSTFRVRIRPSVPAQLSERTL